MPIYEYACSNCGHHLEAIQKMSDAALVDCPQCGKPSLQKQISASGFRLKGAGWYETDFKSGSKRNVADSDSKKSEPKAACGAGACPACAD
ncbi:MAG: zinc ribbon domain-containing protein [Gammaproteobacteria bacterium]